MIVKLLNFFYLDMYVCLPATAGPTTAGPATAGPTTAGPTTPWLCPPALTTPPCPAADAIRKTDKTTYKCKVNNCKSQ